MSSSSSSEKEVLSLEEFAEPETTALAWWRSLRKRDLWEVLRPYLIDRARAAQCHLVRRYEDDAFSEKPPLAVLCEAVADPLADRARLLDETFVLPDGRRVTWGEATEEEHLEREAFQRRLAGSCISDAERHEAAAELIRECGVGCLNDIAEGEEL